MTDLRPCGAFCEEARSAVMGPRPMGKAPDLKRQTGRVASRLTVRRSWLWTFLACCLLAVVGGPAMDLPQ